VLVDSKKEDTPKAAFLSLLVIRVYRRVVPTFFMKKKEKEGKKSSS